MPTIELTATQRERLEALREEIEAERTAPYTSVTTANVLTYLLDLADTVEDPRRSMDLMGSENAPDEFPREALRAELESRKRKDSTAGNERMDLYSIASAYDITGRSRMTKAELITTVLEEAERRYRTPFAALDVTLPDQVGGDETVKTPADRQSSETISSKSDTYGANSDTTVPTESDPNTRATGDPSTDFKQAAGDTATDSSGEPGQLNAMLNLLDTHDDKWCEADGKSRYEVQLPDGSYEPARTKDDVRALLFKNY